jgi:nucleotidyltransferase/DNA polymerase involved in DNA repair
MTDLQRYACLVIPHLPVRIALQQYPTLAGTPIAIGTPGQRGTLTACSPEACALGLRVGMLAHEAQNLCPQLTVLPADPLASTHLQTTILQALSHVCPTVQRRALGCIDLDLHGLGRHYPSAEALGTALLACVDATLDPRLGMASSSFAAYVAARRTPPGTVRIIDHAALDRLLARCPVELLPLSPATLRRMDQLGLRRFGDIARLPRTVLVAQFGAEGQRAWQLAHGDDPAPFIAEPLPEPISELLRLPAASCLAGELAVACRIVASRLLARPELRGQALRRLRLELCLEHGGVVGRTLLVMGGRVVMIRLV